MVLAAPVIYALASVPAGGLCGTDVLIWRGDQEGSGLAPHVWHPDLPRPHPKFCGRGSYYNPSLGWYSVVGENNNTEFGVGRHSALALLVCLKVPLGKLYLVCRSQFPHL